MVTKSPVAKSASKSPSPVSLEKSPAPEPVKSQPTAAERLMQVQHAIDKVTVKDYEPADVKWGKAIALQGGGSVYINRGNADVRSTPKQVADWVKAGLGTARGPQGQYLRITF